MKIYYTEFSVLYDRLCTCYFRREFDNKLPQGVKNAVPWMWEQPLTLGPKPIYRSTERLGSSRAKSPTYIYDQLRKAKSFGSCPFNTENYMKILAYVNNWGDHPFYDIDTNLDWKYLSPTDQVVVLERAFIDSETSAINAARLVYRDWLTEHKKPLSLADPLTRVLGKTKGKKAVQQNRNAGNEETALDPEVSTSETAAYRLGNLVFNDIQLIGGLNHKTRFIFSHKDEDIVLPPDLLELEGEWKELLKQKQGKFSHGSHDAYAITKISNTFRWTDETMEYHLETKNSNGYHRLAVSLSLDVLLKKDQLTVRQKYFSGFSNHPEKLGFDFLCPYFGVNLTVVTSDMKMILICKSAKVAKTERGRLHFSLGVALHRSLHAQDKLDLNSFAFDRLMLMYRLKKGQIDCLNFYNLNFSPRYCGYAAYGYAKLNISYSELAQSSQLSPIREDYELIAIPFDLPSIQNFILTKKGALITQYALCGILSCLVMFGEYQTSDIIRAFSDDTWRAFSERIAEYKIDFSLDDLRQL